MRRRAARFAGHRAELSTSPNAKATLVQPIKLGPFETTLMGTYDMQECSPGDSLPCS